MRSELGRRVLRRFIVTATLFVVFLLWIGPPATLRENLLPAAAVIGASAVIAFFMSWPRNGWIRAAVFCALAVLVALRQPDGSAPSSGTAMEVIVRAFPVVFLVGLIFLVDAVVAWMLRRMKRNKGMQPV